MNCSVERCEKRAHSKGMCSSHYHRYTRWGDPNAGRKSPRPWAVTEEEIAWLTSFRIHPIQIAAALGVGTASLAKECYRNGRRDWAAMFESTHDLDEEKASA